MEEIRLATGDVAVRLEKEIVLFFDGARKVLSTSLYNGGYREDLTAVYNHDMTRGETEEIPPEALAQPYEAYLRGVSRRLGLDPARATGMGTVARMRCAAVRSLSYEALRVSAIVTGGIEKNGGRAGDPAPYYRSVEKPRPGTINIILSVGADLPPGILTRALVTCTEAKAAALQELMADSRYSSGLATGSGTDQTIIIAHPASPLYFDAAGKHAKLGELIGRVVIGALKEALSRQTTLTPSGQHTLLRRLRRFGVDGDTVWARYRRRTGADDRARGRFMEALGAVAAAPPFFPYGVMYIHLFDEYLWGLVSEDETLSAAEGVLRLLAEAAGVAAPRGFSARRGYMEALEAMLEEAAARRMDG